MSSQRDRSRSPLHLRAPSDRRVYVANIPFDMKWTELKDLFKQECGENSVSFVHFFGDSDGKFRGCGIVELKDADSAKRAIAKLHRYELNGRFLVVKEDHDLQRDSTGRVVSRNNDWQNRGRSPVRRDRSPPAPPTRDYGGPHRDNQEGPGGPQSWNLYGLSPKFLESLDIELPLTNKLFVSNLDYKVSKADLKRLFRICGRVVDVDLYMDKDGHSKGNATVEMDHPVEAVQAISMLNRQIFFGRSLAIRMDRKEGEEPKLPPGLEGIGKGLGPGGTPLKLPRQSSFMGRPPAPPPAPLAPPAPVSAAIAAFNALGYPNDPMALAALTSALDSAGPPRPPLFPGTNPMLGLQNSSNPNVANRMSGQLGGGPSMGVVHNDSNRFGPAPLGGMSGAPPTKWETDVDNRWRY